MLFKYMPDGETTNLEEGATQRYIGPSKRGGGGGGGEKGGEGEGCLYGHR